MRHIGLCPQTRQVIHYLLNKVSPHGSLKRNALTKGTTYLKDDHCPLPMSLFEAREAKEMQGEQREQ